MAGVFFADIAVIFKFLFVLSESLPIGIFGRFGYYLRLLFEGVLRGCLHLGRFGIGMFAFDVGVECSIGTIGFSAFLGAGKCFFYFVVSPPVNSLHQGKLYYKL